MNKAGVNISVYASFVEIMFSFLLDEYTEVGLLGHRACIWFDFVRNGQTFCKMVVPVHSHHQKMLLWLPHILANAWCHQSLKFYPFYECVVNFIWL